MELEIKNNISLQEKREKVVELILERKYGDTITNEEINGILKEDLKDEYGKKRFKSNMNKVKNILITKGIVVRSISNIGYYILMPRQISSYTYRNFIVKPIKNFEKAKIILENTNNKVLNNKEKEEYKKTRSLNDALCYASNELINNIEYKDLKEQERWNKKRG